jgi:hypothetical protein
VINASNQINMFIFFLIRFKIIYRLVVIFSLVVLGINLNASVDHSIWDRLLKKYVTQAGQVDYNGMKKELSQLKNIQIY